MASAVPRYHCSPQFVVAVHLRGGQGDEVVVQKRPETPVALDVFIRDGALNCVITSIAVDL
jgi:hypothetical protein